MSSVAVVGSQVEQVLAGLKDGYTASAAVWMRWMAETGHGVDPVGISAWIHHLDELPLSTNSRNTYLKALKHRARWLLERAPVSASARRAVVATLASIKYQRPAKKPVVALTAAEVRAIVSAAPTKRLATLLEFIASVGSRVSETLNIRVDELADEDGTGQVRVLLHGKGSRAHKTQDRFVWVPNALMARIRRAWRSEGNEYLFSHGARARRFTRNYVSTAVRRISARVVGRPVGVHAFRHAFVTDALWHRHLDLVRVSRWIGHSSTKITEAFYSHGALSAADAVDLVAVL